MKTATHKQLWAIHYDSDIRAVRAQALAGLGREDMPQFCEQVRQFSRQMKCPRMVIDYTAASDAPKSIECASPALAGPADAFARHAQIAFVFDRLDRSLVHAGQVLRERGYTVGIFSDQWAAVDWLN